eukprot:CAMPEP_0119418700 /NCGR_PEP_ID=MMETSP1335-20130426/18937_1 /TAXON_ID=259385 /ORGANISM="Chrysoculter rhomboideus, Strain RCC1486" /LENGTH=191 /DNA_ID=CAMNT_0007443965 /DNA_START=81 /DNA_END=656 /DNA_ORIENTATION=+
MNATVSLKEAVLDHAKGFDVVVADGGDEINAGIFAVRNSKGGRAFLDAYEHDCEAAKQMRGHLPWRDNGYLMHAVLRGIVADAGVKYNNECMRAGIHGSKGAFRQCFWRFRQKLHGLTKDQIDGPRRGSHPMPPNLTSRASFRVHLSSAGVFNNLLSWKPPNDYRQGDLLMHLAGPDKSAIYNHLDKAFAC